MVKHTESTAENVTIAMHREPRAVKMCRNHHNTGDGGIETGQADQKQYNLLEDVGGLEEGGI